jgi:hypothetical protein
MPRVKGVIKNVPLSVVVRIDELQMRPEGTLGEHAEDLMAVIKGGKKLPPVEIRSVKAGPHTGLLLTGGFHTFEAHELAGKRHVRAVVREGTWADALEDAATSNQGPTHRALKPSRAAKRRACEMMLRARPEWSNRAIAEKVGVDEKTVREARAELQVREVIAPTTERVGVDGQTQAVRKLRTQPEAAPGLKLKKFDWRSGTAGFGLFAKTVHNAGKFHGETESLEYQGLKRLLDEAGDLWQAWQKRLAQQQKGK